MESQTPLEVRPSRRAIYLLPNLLTTACLFSGFYAIVAAIDGNFSRAGMAVFIAAIFDGLDGRVARLTHTESAFGKEYDSLADLVAFGLAPALVSYQWGLDKRYFEGLPIPSAAAVVAAFVWAFSEWHEPGLPGLILAFGVTALAGALMVSRFGYPSFKQFDLSKPIRFVWLIVLALVFVFIAGDPPRVLLLLFGTYALWPPVVWVLRRVRRRRRADPGPPA
jgi:CDP-diacylglycerol---serine O-phosphatidyltransferase